MDDGCRLRGRRRRAVLRHPLPGILFDAVIVSAFVCIYSFEASSPIRELLFLPVVEAGLFYGVRGGLVLPVASVPALVFFVVEDVGRARSRIRPGPRPGADRAPASRRDRGRLAGAEPRLTGSNVTKVIDCRRAPSPRPQGLRTASLGGRRARALARRPCERAGARGSRSCSPRRPTCSETRTSGFAVSSAHISSTRKPARFLVPCAARSGLARASGASR